MILDAFFDCLTIKRKLRVHFHQFMLNMQQVRLRAWVLSLEFRVVRGLGWFGVNDIVH